MVSKELQEQNLVFPWSFIFARLSLVRVVPFWRYNFNFKWYIDFPKWASDRNNILYHTQVHRAFRKRPTFI